MHPLVSGSRWRVALTAALIVVCGLIAYSNSFTDLFVGLDGKQSIRDNPHIRKLWPLSEAISLPLWHASLMVHETPAVALRPVFSLSLALTNHFFGLEPRAHHAVNLVIHLLATLVLFGIVRRTLAQQTFVAVDRISPLATASVVALLWMLHPLQTESVTFIVQRAESLMGLFLFLSLYCAMRARDGAYALAWQAAAVIACAIGVGAKQTAALAPLLILLYDFTFASDRGKRWARFVFYAFLATPFLFLPLAFGSMPRRYLGWELVYDYAIKQPAVILHYLRLVIWPDDLYVYVNTTLYDVFSMQQVLFPSLALGALAIATLYAIKRRHWLGFLGAWFFCTLGPTSSILPIPDSIQEHRMYVPLAALVVLGVIVGRWGIDRWAPYRAAWLKVAVSAVVMVAFGWRTYDRNWDYHGEFSMIHPHDLHGNYTILADHFLSDPAILKSEAVAARKLLRKPTVDMRDAPFAHFVLALAHQDAGDLAAAVYEFEKVISLDPKFAYAHKELAVVLRESGDLLAARRHLERALEVDPTLSYALKELALVRMDLGDAVAAEELLRRALRFDEGFGEGYLELGVIAAGRGDREVAAANFRKAIEVRPDLYEAYFELALLLLDAGQEEVALEHLRTAVRLQPDFVEAIVRIGRLQRERGEAEEAFASLSRALEVQPESADALYEMGMLWHERADPTRAAANFTLALQIDPEFAAAHCQLGWLQLKDLKDTAAAWKSFQTALRLDPEMEEAHSGLDAVRAQRNRPGKGSRPGNRMDQVDSTISG